MRKRKKVSKRVKERKVGEMDRKEINEERERKGEQESERKRKRGRKERERMNKK